MMAVVVTAVLLVSVLGTSAGQAAEPGPRIQTVQFARGASGTLLQGTITGRASIDYRIAARAGQTLAVDMKTSNASSHFNVLPPATEAAMFIGSSAGPAARLLLPTDGTYVVRVYLMRSAARRGEQARYTLDIGMGGTALAALPDSQDARVAGTPYHATAEVSCQLPYGAPAATCRAGVIRRGRDGTATVELSGDTGPLRRLLFVERVVVASDSTEPVAGARDGDTTTVRIGADERYAIPDALLTGG